MRLRHCAAVLAGACLAPLALLTPVAFGAEGAPAKPPPSDFAHCGLGFTHGQPSSGTVSYRIKATCGRTLGFEHGLTVQRSGKVITRRYTRCKDNLRHSTTICYASGTIPDPAGTQKFSILDEYTSYYGADGSAHESGKKIFSWYS